MFSIQGLIIVAMFFFAVGFFTAEGLWLLKDYKLDREVKKTYKNMGVHS